MAESANFPVISFAPFLDPNAPESEQLAVAQKLYDAFHTYGWVYLKDFGISDEEVARMFALSKSYFDQPIEAKLANALSDPAVNQGYTADGAEVVSNRKPDHKECYEYRRFKNPQLPDPAALPDFEPRLRIFYDKCLQLSAAVLSALALSIGLPRDFFARHLTHADPQLRLLHYMPIPAATIANPDEHSRIHAHTDYGLCTILFQDLTGGLEVDPFHTGAFVPATPLPGTCVINVADLLQRWSNDRLRSTLHRVVSPPPSSSSPSSSSSPDGTTGDAAAATAAAAAAAAATTMLPARYSTAFFVHPSPDTTVAPVVVDEGETARYEPVNAGEWRTSITARNYSLPVEEAEKAVAGAAVVA
ncbi:clavaminate synthase-like protein [Diplodia corticola]|uniref:Clavaminate synthase-like protein n=1 Tax=Diplodia corticola TaxID=236234 RepID=A0A1J9RMY2_9PEZI|nr:clavaminate synthase-like protein [Diplodia corticola]OJD29863.1 clavaminate synthase-like protein [Diplodia corticola]